MSRMPLMLALILSLAVAGVTARQSDPETPADPEIPSLSTSRVSVRSGGAEANGASEHPAISADGNLVALASRATNLVDGDTNGKQDIFVHDRSSGQTSRVSIRTGGLQANGDSFEPAISANGRYVAFRSQANNLVDGDSNNASDIFLHDRQTGSTIRISVNSSGAQANGPNFDPDLSGDGRYVTFWSNANNLASGDFNSKSDVFVRDWIGGATWRVSLANNGQEGNDDSFRPAISDDGRYVAFESYASNFVANDLAGYRDVFLHDWIGRTTVRASRGLSGAEAQGDSYNPAISGDGGIIAFTSLASNIVGGDTNLAADVFVYARIGGALQRVSVRTDGGQANGLSDQAAVSQSGRFVVFRSDANNLVSGDTNNISDVFVRDRQDNATSRASVTNLGAQGNSSSDNPAVNGDGLLVAFRSLANNLVTGDNNGTWDIFVRDRTIPPPPPAKLTAIHTAGALTSSFAFNAAHFPPNQQGTVRVNGQAMGFVQTDFNGNVVFDICTVQTSELGYYAVSLTVSTAADEAGFQLTAGGTVWPPSGQTSFCVLGNSALTEQMRLPLVGRN